MIEQTNCDHDFLLNNFEVVSEWVNNCIQEENRIAGDISIIYCSDNQLLSINKQYLNHDYFTDIITFNYNEGNIISGDIFISIDRVEENAQKFKVELFRELYRIIIHGVLHLIGYNDKSAEEKQAMTQKEDYYLNLLP